MRSLVILVFANILLCKIDGAAVAKDVDRWKTDLQEFDPDDDTDPFEDEGEDIQYPAKSVMPKSVAEDPGPQIISEGENGSGSGAETIKIDQNVKLANRLANLEQYLILLATKLNKQEQVNNDLLSAIRSQQLQQMQEKNAFGNTIGSLQGTISQLLGRVNQIPLEINRERKRRRQQYLTSAINTMSEKLNQLGNEINKTPARRGSDLVTRGKESTVGLLGKLLGKDVAKALSASSPVTSKAGTKALTAAVEPLSLPSPVTTIAAQPMVPIDLQPQSHVTSLSTPTGQGPAGSASSTPIQPNFSYVQVPSQTNIAAPSTPTGSGPVGSVSTMGTGVVPFAEQPKTVSFTSVASKFKPPVTAGGYNILPYVPLPQIQAPQAPLEAPSIISPQVAPQAAVVADAAAPAPVLPATPGVVSPYEVLTSSQMVPNAVPPVGADTPLFNRRGSQDGNPYEMLTSSQMRSHQFNTARLTKHRKIAKIDDRKRGNYPQAQTSGIKHINKSLSKGFKSKEENSHSKTEDGKKSIKDVELGAMKKNDSSSQAFNVAKDPLFQDLEKAMRIGTLRKVDHERNTLNQQTETHHTEPEKYSAGTTQHAKLRGIVVQTEARK